MLPQLLLQMLTNSLGQAFNQSAELFESLLPLACSCCQAEQDLHLIVAHAQKAA